MGFFLLFSATVDKDLFELNCRLRVYNLSHFLTAESLVGKKHYCWSGIDWETILFPVILFISPLLGGQHSHFSCSF